MTHIVRAVKTNVDRTVCQRERERERVGQITRKLASSWKTSETRENTEEAKYVLMPDEGKDWKPKKTRNSNMCPPTNTEKMK